MPWSRSSRASLQVLDVGGHGGGELPYLLRHGRNEQDREQQEEQSQSREDQGHAPTTLQAKTLEGPHGRVQPDGEDERDDDDQKYVRDAPGGGDHGECGHNGERRSNPVRDRRPPRRPLRQTRVGVIWAGRGPAP